MFKKLRPDAIIPQFGNKDKANAGIDFYSPVDATIDAKGSIIIDTGVAWEPDTLGDFDTLPYAIWKPAMIIKGRSGLSIKHGIEACMAGVIDSSFRGAISIKLYNTTDKPYEIKAGDRIAQGVVVALPEITIREVDTLSDSARGTNGFGSSGR